MGMFAHERRFLTELSAGSGTEALVGAAAVILAILGLAGIEASYMAPIAAIAVGAALLLEGVVLMAKQAEISTAFSTSESERLEASGGVSAEVLGGMGGIVLGILALINIVPNVLLPISLLVFGGCMLFGAGMTAHVRNFVIEPSSSHPAGRMVAHEAALASIGAEALVALASIVLGILALVHIVPMTLVLVGMLILGASILLTGSAMTAWMLSAGRRMTV
jgi:hypothetical protein